MHSKETLKWLEDNNLLGIAEENAFHFERVLRECLNPSHEEVLIVGDKGYPGRHIAAIIAASYYLAAHRLGLNANLVIERAKLKGDFADDDVVEAIANLKAEGIVTVSLSGVLGKLHRLGASCREYFKFRGHRFLSTLSLGVLETEKYSSVINAIDIDYNLIKKKAEAVAGVLDGGSEVHVTTSSGTDFYYKIRGCKSVLNHGIYPEPGTGGNLPAGEVYIPPEGRYLAEGKIVIDGSSAVKNGSRVVKNPITLRVEKGKITEINGKEEAKELEESLLWAENNAKYPWGTRLISEFGIGLNPNAKLTGAMIVDEKILGTAHVAMGSNYWFGGNIYAIIHFDQVFNKPRIYVDGEELKVW